MTKFMEHRLRVGVIFLPLSFKDSHLGVLGPPVVPRALFISPGETTRAP